MPDKVDIGLALISYLISYLITFYLTPGRITKILKYMLIIESLCINGISSTRFVVIFMNNITSNIQMTNLPVTNFKKKSQLC